MRGRHQKSTRRIDWQTILIGAVVVLIVGLILKLIDRVT